MVIIRLDDGLRLIGREASLTLFGKSLGVKSVVPIPPELTDEASLLTYLGLSPKELKKIWWFRRKMYREFLISKSSGKKRVINAPDDRLKFLQQKIAQLLDQLYRIRKPVHGFVAKRSVKSNASSHLGKHYVINLDIKDYFLSISQNRIEGLLNALGLDQRVAAIIARLCCHNDCLPQGAPTSPVLSNMICFKLDKALMQFAKNEKAIYTRYADDITFSSHRPPIGFFETSIPPSGRFHLELLKTSLRNEFTYNGFAINPTKVHFADRHARRTVTGLKVNELVNIDRYFVRDIRAKLHSIEKLGLADSQVKYEEKAGPSKNLRSHLVGKISWLAFIKGPTDPLVRSVMLRFNKCFPGTPLRVKPTDLEMRERAVWVVQHDGEIWSQGTCFFLKGVGLVTAAHCVKDFDSIDIYHPTKPTNTFPAKVKALHEARDLAILSHTIPKTEYYELELAVDAVEVESQSTSLGYPDIAKGDVLNIRQGTVSSLPKRDTIKIIEVTQKIVPGMSGGPTLDAKQKVIGINHKGGAKVTKEIFHKPGFPITTQETTENLRDFAIHIDELKTWLSETPLVE